MGTPGLYGGNYPPQTSLNSGVPTKHEQESKPKIILQTVSSTSLPSERGFGFICVSVVCTTVGEQKPVCPTPRILVAYYTVYRGSCKIFSINHITSLLKR